MERVRLIGKQTATLHLNKKQVTANVEYEGGFLSTLLSLAVRALPTILGGLTTGLISGGVEKAIKGNGATIFVQGWSWNEDNTNTWK